MNTPRNIETPIVADLNKKFVFLSGPRQVGKTTLAKRVMKGKGGRYLLYDDDDDRRVILQKGYLADPWVCLDEFHKFPRWKSHIKGVFDKYHERLHLLLTGSARLDVFQKSGDSLFGRYYLYHLHPLTCGELQTAHAPSLPNDLLSDHAPFRNVADLLKLGGFPEPYYSQSEQEHRRWSNTRRQLLIREDLRDISHIELISLVEQLMLLLPQRIGSLFSYRSLAEDIRVAPQTIKTWMEVFQRLFVVFQVPPYSVRISRSLQRQPKFYFYDWSQITDEGSRFENFVASHLWKAAQLWTDLGLANVSLYYLRDRDRREVDFLLTREGKPWLLVEAKLSEARVADNLDYFARKLNVPAVQVLLKEGVYRKENLTTVASANRWLGNLP